MPGAEKRLMGTCMPTENLNQSNTSNDKSRKKTLLHMHRFYTEEARNQRSMMLEAVKWFTLILTAIAGGWIKLYSDFIYISRCNVGAEGMIFMNPCAEGMVLFLLSLLGIALSIACVKLLKSFYITNLEHITMFAKVEEELNFDKRIKRDKYFIGDNFITWHKYLKDRTNDKLEGIETCGYKSTKLVKNLTKDCITKHVGMYDSMKRVFYIFSGVFIISLLPVTHAMFGGLVPVTIVISLFAFYAYCC